MSGKQKECGYSWTSEGEIHTCNLPEGHTEAHICGFVFNPSDCCLERAEPTPPEGEAVPEPNSLSNQKRTHIMSGGSMSDFKPAPVVSTAAPEPQPNVWRFDRYRNGRKMAEGIIVNRAKTPQEAWEIAKSMADTGDELREHPVAPESYKPAEEVMPTATEDDDRSHIRRSAKEASLKTPGLAASPVTVEAPENLAYQFKEELNAKLDAALATPKPIGDVEAVAAEIWRFVHAHYRAEITKQEIAAILSPFFAPAPPCSECATPPAKWTEDSSLETWFPLTAEELRRTKERLAELEQELLERTTQRNLAREARENWRGRAEAAEAQLSTLRDELLKSRQLKNKLLKSLSRKHRQQGQRAQELDQLKRKLAALAPTPEVAPESVKLVSKREPTEAEIKQGLELQPMAEECLKRNKTPEVAPKE